MIDLNPFVSPAVQKRIGSLAMSDQAGSEIATLLSEHGNSELATPQGYGPVVAQTVSEFLDSAYFARSEWFRRQTIHSTTALQIRPPESTEPPVVPLFALQKTKHGYSVMSCSEASLPESYFVERVIEEVKVETGIC